MFLCVLHVLSYMLNDLVYRVEGLTLLDKFVVRVHNFVDDTALYLKGSAANMHRAFVFIKLLCRALGGRLNWAKSNAFWISYKAGDWQWREDKGFK